MLVIKQAAQTDYMEIAEVWEASVRATHHFLNQKDIVKLKRDILESYLPAQDNLYCVRNDNKAIIAFIGISEGNIDMLFIHPSERGKGVGKELILFAVNEMGATKVDVNEQNDQAIGFYRKMGFEIIGRDDMDSNGKSYPILHMKLKKLIDESREKVLVEKHPLGFYLPQNTKLLMLGSFPPKKERWSMDFYYPNFQNDMWRIMGSIFYSDKDYFVADNGKAFDKIKAKSFCEKVGIGIGDTAEEIIRLKDNASDKYLKVIKPINLQQVMDGIPLCNAIVITGQKAMDTLLSVLSFEEPKVGSCSITTFNNRELKIYRMPSSSRAYPKSLMEKAAEYKKMFQSLNMVVK